MKTVWNLVWPLFLTIAFGWLLRSDLRRGVTGVGNFIFANVERAKHPVGFWLIVTFLALVTLSGAIVFLANLADLLT